MSGVSRDGYYNPDQAIDELLLQKQIVDQAVDIQVLLRILVDKEIITRDEVAQYRNEVRTSPKYANAINKIKHQLKGFEAAKSDPQGYLQALLKAKMEGKIK